MIAVEAVKNRDDINTVTHLLRKIGGDIYADIWKVGVNLSLRISDLLAIRFSDLDLDNRSLTLKEQKTAKIRHLRLNNTVIEIVKKRLAEHPTDEYLFQVHSNRAKNKPISRQMVARKFKEVGEIVNINLSTHSMRKSRGYAMWADGVPVEMITKVLNHSNPAVTMAYLGITKQEVLDTYDQYEL